jgi:lactate dehydrogenase-like 2-hydroxyacid dehydrogenase
MSAGTDNIDKAELKRRNIVLGNTPNVLNAAVADLAVMLMIAASRRVKEGIEQVERCI